jgi:putative phosphoribosyl transferase
MFKYRTDAGEIMATKLIPYKNEPDVLLAMPTGGLPVAYMIARELGFPMEVVLTKKIGHPLHKWRFRDR